MTNGTRLVISLSALGKREDKWQPRKGLEGPFFYVNGKVLYYDPKEGKYWDPKTDWYVTQDEMNVLHQMTVDLLAKEHIVRSRCVNLNPNVKLTRMNSI